MSALIDELGQTHPAIVKLVTGAGIHVADVRDLHWMNDILQTHWMQTGPCHYRVAQMPMDEYVMGLLRELGCVDEVLTPTGAYNIFDGALLLGGNLVDKVRPRLKFLYDETLRGVYFNTLYLLGSERRLDETTETEKALQFPVDGGFVRKFWYPEHEPLPTTEIEMMRYVVRQSVIPDTWKIVEVRTSDFPILGPGSRHADTGDTLKQWLEQEKFGAGRFLVVSNNPHVGYQTATARRILPSNMFLYGIGPAARADLPLGVYLDSLAKQFWEEVQTHKPSRL